MNFEKIISNKPVSEELRRCIEKTLTESEELILTVVGDILLNSTYGNSVLVFTNSRILCFEENGSDDGFFMRYEEIESAVVKRMYGNALLQINGQSIMRFSFAIVSLMETVAEQLTKLGNGEPIDEATEGLIVAVKKLCCVCPKCGSALIREGAPCINCMGKTTIIKKLWHYIRPQKWVLLLCLLTSGVVTSSLLVPPYVTKTLVDDVIPNAKVKKLIMLVVLLLGIYLIQCVLGTIRGYLMRDAGNKIVTDLRNDVYSKAQYLPVSFYDKTSTGSMISRISGDTSTINSFMLTVTQEAIVQFFTLIGIIIIMFSLNWRLTLLSLIPIPFVTLGSRYFGKRLKPIYHRIWMRWSSISGILSDTLPGVRVIKSFTGEKRAINKFGSYNDNWYNESKRVTALGMLLPHVITFMVSCGSLAIWGIGGKWAMVSVGNMTIGLLVSFISYSALFYGPVKFFAGLSDSYQQALTSVERILDILDAEPEHDHGKGNLISDVKGKIEYKNVNFSFDKTTKTLANINLTIEPGDIVGIVGTTGSGKSTLVNLFMRFYDDYEGKILLDGKDIRTIDLESYREKIGIVQQDSIMFRDTVFNNIAFANPNATTEQVFEAADTANVHNFVSVMPDSYDTMLGERGVGLSGGERQRLSIARAVIKNPSILIFDEATAAVDSETEHLIQGAIERLISGRTTIMIAHRLSTLRKANKIVVVDKGRIIECGTPEELMAKKGKYYRLVEIQGMAEKVQKESIKEHLEVG